MPQGPQPAGPALPPVFHPVEGRADCGGCHLTGAAGSRPLPAAHQEYLAVPCRSCNQQAGGGLAAAYALPSASLLVCVLGLMVVARRVGWRRR